MEMSVNVQQNQLNKHNRRNLGQKVKTHFKSALTTGSLSSLYEKLNFLLTSVLSRVCLICIFTRVCMGRDIEPKIAKNYR